MITEQARVQLKTAYGVFYLSAFSDNADDPMPHLVISSENYQAMPSPNVRVHSECITGELFKSERCECGQQLDFALDYIAKHGGILIYLRQEGRGIGIINKIKAYVEQDRGYDTAEANHRLGFGYDDREYDDAITILEHLNVNRLNLLTNNPDKINALANGKIIVEKRIPVEIPPNQTNESYLKTKKDFFGHLLNSV